MRLALSILYLCCVAPLAAQQTVQVVTPSGSTVTVNLTVVKDSLAVRDSLVIRDSLRLRDSTVIRWADSVRWHDSTRWHADGVPIVPGQSIQAAVMANPAGTTFLIKAGTYIRQSIVPKDRDTFRCEAGAILDGENATTYAFDGVPVKASNVTIVGCRATRYKPSVQMGAFRQTGSLPADGGTGWVFDSVEADNNANLGIRCGPGSKVLRSKVHHNGTLGVGCVGDNITVETTEIAFNNYLSAGVLGFETGGTKFALTSGLILRNNDVHDNNGPGLWTDGNNQKYLIEGNRVVGNLQEGIVTEVSYAGVIRNNIVLKNGLGDSRKNSWPWGAGIAAHASGGVEVYSNIVDGNAQGIVGLQQNRGSGSQGPYLVQNLYVHDNTITCGPGSVRAAGIAEDVGNPATFTSRGNRFVNNTYSLVGCNAQPFVWMGYRTAAQWKGYGQQ